MPIPAHYKELVSALSDATQEGRVHWRESARGQEFVVSLKESSVVINRYVHQESDRWMISMDLKNAEGNIADSFAVMELTGDWDLMERLYRLALRRARLIDETVSEIMSELQSGEEIGEPPAKDQPISDDNIPF